MQTIIGDVYSPQERPKIQGYLSGVWGFSAIVGPLLGAFIVEHLSWSLVFWVNLPIGAAAMTTLAMFLPEPKLRRPRSIDVAGAVLLVLAVGSLMFALLHAIELRWWLVLMLAGSLFCLLLLLVQERRAWNCCCCWACGEGDRTILASNIGGLAIGAAMMATSAFLPTYVQAVMGRDVIASGLVLALMSIGWPIASTLGGRLMLVTSYRTTAVIGGFLLMAGSFMLPWLGRDLLGACIAATLIGAGMGMSSTTFMVSVQNAATRSMRGIATASTVFMRMLGSSLGSAVLGAVMNISLFSVVGDPVQTLMDPEKRVALPAGTIASLTASVGAGALHHVCSGAAAALGVRWLLRRPASAPAGTAARGCKSPGDQRASRSFAPNPPMMPRREKR